MDVMEIDEIKAAIDYERSRKGPPEGFPGMPEIPPRRYTDPDFYQLELKHAWRKSWLYAIHGDEVPEPGSFMRWNLMGEPLLFVRGQDGVVRCFYNTCRHRGAPITTEDSGNARGFSCGYHGWTYNLAGDLIRVRDQRDFVGLDMSCRSLIPVRCESIGRYVFINLEDNGQSLDDYLGRSADLLKLHQPDTLRLVAKQTYHVKSNVKVLLEAFLESYHIKSIHNNTVDRFLDHRGVVINMWSNGHSQMITPYRSERIGWVDPGTVGLPVMDNVSELLRTSTLQTMFYPNFMIAWAEAGSPAMVFWPAGLDRSVCEVHWFAPSWGDGPRPEVWDLRLRNFERILMEDVMFQEGIQRSLESHGYKGSMLSYQERRIYHWHQEADRRIGKDVPEELRVAPVLDPYIEEG
ncbi:MAG: aromatic ring-hydroxylating dioxygenase subunit alpha [Sphingobium sp.]